MISTKTIPVYNYSDVVKDFGGEIGSGATAKVYNKESKDSPKRVYKVIKNDTSDKYLKEIEITKIASDLGVCPVFRSCFLMNVSSDKQFVVIEMDKADAVVSECEWVSGSGTTTQKFLEKYDIQPIDYYFGIFSRIKELAESKLAFTDPNIGNIVFDTVKRKIMLIDFGDCESCKSVNAAYERVSFAPLVVTLSGAYQKEINNMVSEKSKHINLLNSLIDTPVNGRKDLAKQRWGSWRIIGVAAITILSGVFLIVKFKASLSSSAG